MVWIAWNLLAPGRLQFDPWDRGLVLLTLVLSLQAAYAAPLILLAQNRQEARDRTQVEFDREHLRAHPVRHRVPRPGDRQHPPGLADVVTNEDLDDRIERLTKALEQLVARLEPPEAEPQPS